MATVGQRGHINPSQDRLGLELLLNASGYSLTWVTESRLQQAFSSLSSHSEGKAELCTCGLYPLDNTTS